MGGRTPDSQGTSRWPEGRPSMAIQSAAIIHGGPTSCHHQVISVSGLPLARTHVPCVYELPCEGFGNPCNIHETIIYVSLWRTGIHLRGDVIMSSMQFFWNCLGVGDVSILSFSITASPALRVARVMESITG